MDKELSSLVEARENAGKIDSLGDLEHLKFYYAFVKGLVVLLIMVTTWMVKLQITVSTNSDFRNTQLATDKVFDTYITQNNLGNQTLNSSIESLRDRIKNVEKIVPSVQEMWFMKEHGISNKDDYFLKTGKSPPNGPITDGGNP